MTKKLLLVSGLLISHICNGMYGSFGVTQQRSTVIKPGSSTTEKIYALPDGQMIKSTINRQEDGFTEYNFATVPQADGHIQFQPFVQGMHMRHAQNRLYQQDTHEEIEHQVRDFGPKLPCLEPKKGAIVLLPVDIPIKISKPVLQRTEDVYQCEEDTEISGTN